MPAPILILSNPSDIHYHAVDWALKQIDVEAQLVFGQSFPRCEQQSFLIDNDNFTYRAIDATGREIDMMSAQTVWYRRGTQPKVSSQISMEDRRLAQNEAEMFIRGIHTVASKHQRWINPPDFEAIASRKPYQLFAAKSAGLKIPRTLMSNNPDEVKSFIIEAGGQVLFKTFTSMMWEDEDNIATLYANRLGLEDIDDWDLIKLTSHIFQHYVEKQFELRVIYLDGKALAYRLNSQQDERSKLDWRMLNSRDLCPEFHELPDDVSQALCIYMKSVGLEFGAIDMIVDPEGNHIFLECNPTGQFLFLEDWNPDLNVLAEFVVFLTKNLDLTEAQRNRLHSLRFKDFIESGINEAYYGDLAARYPIEYQTGLVAQEGKQREAEAVAGQ